MPRFSPYTQCHTYTASTSFQPRWWLKKPTWASGKYPRRNHEGTTEGRQDGAKKKQALEGVTECGRSPPQERVHRDGEHDREDNPVDVVEDATGQELHVRRRFRRVDRAVDAVPVQLRESDAGHEVTDHRGQVRRNEARQQCGADPVVAHPGPVPVDAPSRRATSRSINRRVTVLARGKDGVTQHDHPPWMGCGPTA